MARGRKPRKFNIRRQPNGQPSRARSEVGSAIPDAALDRRAEATGMDRGDKRLSKVDGSSALGILFQRGIIQRHHFDAGNELHAAHHKWAVAIEAKTRSAKSADYPWAPTPTDINDEPVNRRQQTEMTADEWARIKARYMDAKGSIPRGLRWSLVECVVLDNVVAPNMTERGDLCDRIRAELVLALDALCKHFNISAAENKAA